MKRILISMLFALFCISGIAQTRGVYVHDKYMQLIAVSKYMDYKIKCDMYAETKWCDMCEWNGWHHYHYYAHDYYVAYDFRPVVKSVHVHNSYCGHNHSHYHGHPQSSGTHNVIPRTENSHIYQHKPASSSSRSTTSTRVSTTPKSSGTSSSVHGSSSTRSTNSTRR